jgi:hypothetical protein
MVEQPIARERLARMAQEVLEQRELARAELDALAVRGDLATRLVQGDPADLQAQPGPDRLRATGPSGERAQTGGELLECERLDEVVVGARVEAGHPVDDGVARREDEDRDRRSLRAQIAGDVGPEPSGRPMSRTSPRCRRSRSPPRGRTGHPWPAPRRADPRRRLNRRPSYAGRPRRRADA